jgi:hypothetical protein
MLMASVMCEHLSMQEDYILKHTNAMYVSFMLTFYQLVDDCVTLASTS